MESALAAGASAAASAAPRSREVVIRMPPRSRTPGPTRRGGAPRQSPGSPRQASDGVGQFGARADAELRVDARKIVLDRLLAEQELAGDLLVRATTGDEPGDLRLALRQQAIGSVGGSPAGGADPGA